MKKENLNFLLNEFDLFGCISFNDYIEKRTKKISNILLKKPSFIDNYGNYDRFAYAESIIVVAMNFCDSKQEKNQTSVMAQFAKGMDYHLVMTKRIKKVIDQLQLQYPNNTFEYTVDTGALDEKFAAVLAGIGNLGKNGLVINKLYGSFLLLGTIITDLKMNEYDLHHQQDICGECRRCIDSCPVSAIGEYSFDREQCISGQLQSKREISIDTISKIKNMVYGCDICQKVCPHNLITKKCLHDEFMEDELASFNLDWFAKLSNAEYKKIFKHKAINWLKYDIVLRNAIINALNADEDVIEYIEKFIVKYKEKEYFVKTLQNCYAILNKET